MPRYENAPLPLLYASGNVALNDVDEILLLNVLQSAAARYPSVEPLAFVSVSVEPESDSGPLYVSVCTALVPLPTKMPVSVELAVPPLATPRIPVSKFVPILVVEIK